MSRNAAETNKNYYHSVLEKLFFEVLNTKQVERKKFKGYELYKDIPFLNGGLFEPHNDDHYKPSLINTLIIPDKWLTEFLSILETYNFTIDENTSIDVELSIDPEMLGRIFENLLAEINPETGETARKSTGSYYTPRAIVEYMVDESLKQYLITKTSISEDKLSILLSYSSEETEISIKESEKIIYALDEIKILDPACGSGAFPIGILQKLLLILQKIDKNSTKWLEKKLKKIESTVLRNELKAKFKNENLDYIRKLGLIQDSIYGVDIQSIAVEISKLRCFLTLIVDEDVDDKKPNRGIIPLPNLEFKFVAANTLISLPEEEGSLFDESEYIKQLEGLRDEYFTSFGQNKLEIESDFISIQEKMFKKLLRNGITEGRAFELAGWCPFFNDKADWFDPKWMFGIQDGFDIVIGNPPYIVSKDKILKEIYAEIVYGRPNLYFYFIHTSLKNILKENGVLVFINPRTILTDTYATALRKFIINYNSILSILNVVDRKNIFESVLQSVLVNIYMKGKDKYNNIKIKSIARKDDLNKEFLTLKNSDVIINHNGNLYFLVANSYLAYSIINKLICYESFESIGLKFTTGKIQWDLYKKYLSNKPDKFATRLIWAENIQRYYFQNSKNRVNKEYLNVSLSKINHLDYKTIIIQRTTAVEQEYRIISTIIDPNKLDFPIISENHTTFLEKYPDKIHLNFILGLLNSKLYDFLFRHINSNTQVSSGEINSLPIKMSSPSFQQFIVKNVDKIFITKSNSEDTTLLENEIDIMVYKLYELTYYEVKIIDPEFWMSEGKYEKFEIK